jgi:succinate dehydrogenase / fumarate reductase flavoprotein subunit
VGPLKNGVYLDFKQSIERDGEDAIEDRYSNLFEMYERITDENPYKIPMRIYPAPHYTMGGLWVDYNLMTTIPGLYAIGEANFSDHGANRLGASALMQGLADGYFVLPYTIGDYLGQFLNQPVVDPQEHTFNKVAENVEGTVRRFMTTGGTKSVDYFHKELGKIMLENCGMARNEVGLEKAISEIAELHKEYQKDVKVLGSAETFNQSLEKAQRVDDFFELAQLMCVDALGREESCGGHFREEHQTEEGEAIRDDRDYAYVAAWEWSGKAGSPRLHKEELEFESVALATRSYK